MAAEWKMPPIIKVYEALGALGDGRVRIVDASKAEVMSSEGDKTYEVENSADLREISSNDNASYWQGYLGYPAIAVLIARGAIDRPTVKAIDALAGIPWKELNRRFRNDYAKTLAQVELSVEERGGNRDVVRASSQAVLEALRRFAPIRGQRRRPPTSTRASR